VKHEALPMEQNGDPFSVPVYDRIFNLIDLLVSAPSEG
jgi:hypothetical protein